MCRLPCGAALPIPHLSCKCRCLTSHPNPPRALTEVLAGQAGGSVLASASEPGTYRPKTEATRGAYEQLLHFLSSFMGEQPADILRGAGESQSLVNDSVRKYAALY